MLSGCVWWLMKGRGVECTCGNDMFAASRLCDSSDKKKKMLVLSFIVILKWVFDKASNQSVVTVHNVRRMEEADEDQALS